MSSDFYNSLTFIDDFNSIQNDECFIEAPAQNRVVVADIKNSTKAIEQGLYKEVNFIGAAVIAVVSNVLKTKEFAFSFGGDGATLMLNQTQWNTVKKELIKLRHLSQKKFGLDLRVGSITVNEIKELSGYQVRVAKLRMIGERSMALFKGGGLQFADSLIKSESKYELIGEASAQPDLSDLSCRWKPVPNQRGIIISLIMVQRENAKEDEYALFMAKLKEILQTDLIDHNPVYHNGMAYENIFKMKKVETKAGNHRRKTSLHYFVGRVISYFLFAFKGYKLFDLSQQYINELGMHSDFRKFDDALRMTLDCTLDQKELIFQYLKSRLDMGSIYYGTHQAENALMTCFVPEMSTGNHIHFIDSENGGYALAAKQLKAQMN